MPVGPPLTRSTWTAAGGGGLLHEPATRARATTVASSSARLGPTGSRRITALWQCAGPEATHAAADRAGRGVTARDGPSQTISIPKRAMSACSSLVEGGSPRFQRSWRPAK